mmetsp:Transcript_47786/g.84639  ORF Transcript_47786/g.84639 Transcript_47786/m.84639 type:complete len:212 (-) Transcript_47786:2326-2961(-)
MMTSSKVTPPPWLSRPCGLEATPGSLAAGFKVASFWGTWALPCLASLLPLPSCVSFKASCCVFSTVRGAGTAWMATSTGFSAMCSTCKVSSSASINSRLSSGWWSNGDCEPKSVHRSTLLKYKMNSSSPVGSIAMSFTLGGSEVLRAVMRKLRPAIDRCKRATNSPGAPSASFKGVLPSRLHTETTAMSSSKVPPDATNVQRRCTRAARSL